MSCSTNHDRFGVDQRAIISLPGITALFGSSLGLGPHSDGLWHTPIDSRQIRIAPGMWYPVKNKPLEESLHHNATTRAEFLAPSSPEPIVRKPALLGQSDGLQQAPLRAIPLDLRQPSFPRTSVPDYSRDAFVRTVGVTSIGPHSPFHIFRRGVRAMTTFQCD